jgi:transcriptional regulator with XRE-family HTH domain
MPNTVTNADRREAGAVMAEMASDRLFTLINERFEELQVKHGLSQSDIARRMGAAPQAICRWMREPRNLTIKTAGRLLAALEAHLLFDLDRFEDMGGNGVVETAEPTIVVNPEKYAQFNITNGVESFSTTIRYVSADVGQATVRSLVAEDA